MKTIHKLATTAAAFMLAGHIQAQGTPADNEAVDIHTTAQSQKNIALTFRSYACTENQHLVTHEGTMVFPLKEPDDNPVTNKERDTLERAYLDTVASADKETAENIASLIGPEFIEQLKEGTADLGEIIDGEAHQEKLKALREENKGTAKAFKDKVEAVLGDRLANPPRRYPPLVSLTITPSNTCK